MFDHSFECSCIGFDGKWSLHKMHTTWAIMNVSEQSNNIVSGEWQPKVFNAINSISLLKLKGKGHDENMFRSKNGTNYKENGRTNERTRRWKHTTEAKMLIRLSHRANNTNIIHVQQAESKKQQQKTPKRSNELMHTQLFCVFFFLLLF